MTENRANLKSGRKTISIARFSNQKCRTLSSQAEDEPDGDEDGPMKQPCPLFVLKQYVCEPDTVNGTVKDPRYECRDVLRFFEMCDPSSLSARVWVPRMQGRCEGKNSTEVPAASVVETGPGRYRIRDR